MAVVAAGTGCRVVDRSIEFGGTGTDRGDRVEIPVDPPTPVDVGSTDFTIEWWMRGRAADNAQGYVTCGAGVYGWITGHTIVDRDRWPLSGADGRDFGVSVGADGRLAFGVENASGQRRTVCTDASVSVLDGQWHHVAVQRSTSGTMQIFVDGVSRASASGPAGDISYPDGFPTARPTDPYLVIGAEKHDAGPDYPSFRGKVDGVRISNVLRYTSDGPRPARRFAPDANTVGLYQLDDVKQPSPGGTTVTRDSSRASGSPTNGVVRGSSDGAWPRPSADNPFAPS
ncbi:MAG: hypothetical protein KatS3mg008_2045 [Acidimicrobiales bacterium]|nr:MAG: hypothetical protein KatS3mg008_2045 [Acidimicrobiales bacterium]